MQESQRHESEKYDRIDFNSWPLDSLIDYICREHHAFVEGNTPLLKDYLNKTCQVHSVCHSELLQVREIFFQIGDELTANLRNEELLLFPFIKKLEAAKHTKIAVTSALLGSVIIPISMIKIDHATEGEKFKQIAKLTNHYKVPSNASITFSATYRLLEEYENNLRMHILLENKILFQKAIALEEQWGIINFL